MIIFVAFVFIMGTLVSAGFFDWFKRTITGYATSQPTNVSIVVSGTSQITMIIFNQSLTGSTVDPTENATTYITFYVVINDSDGVADINDSSVSANVTFGSTVRRNNTCTLIGDLDTQRANYSCRLDMWYFDAPETWTINVRANDLGNTSYVVNTSSFKYNQLQAIVVSPNSLTFPSVAIGATNQTSNNDPTLVNNTGNGNLSAIRVQAINIHGLTTTTQFIPVANFTVFNNTAATVECNENSATALVNNTATAITGLSLVRGNHSISNGTSIAIPGQQLLYYCIRDVPTSALISAQQYSTNNTGSWTISVV